MKAIFFWSGILLITVGLLFCDTYATPQTLNGKTLYERKCARCHGEDGTAQKRNVPNLKKSDITDAERIEIITNGEEKMPAFGKKLTKQEILAVAAYAKSMKK